jgi:hypothetical protein
VDGSGEHKTLRQLEQEAAERRRALGFVDPDSPPYQQPTPPGPGRRRRAVMAVVLWVAGMGAFAVLAKSISVDDGGATPPLAGTVADAAPVEPDDPFYASPVQAWGVGVEQIAADPPAAVGPFSAEQVADAYAKTRAYAAAAFLDPAVLHDGVVEPVLATLDPESITWFTENLAQPTEEDDPVFLVNRFSPDDVAPATPEARVNGQMTASMSDEEPGLLAVDLSAVFVYALTPAPGGGPATLVSVRRDVTLLFEPDAQDITKVGSAWWYQGYYLNNGSRCGVPPQRLGFLDVWFFEPDGADDAPVDDTYNALDLDAEVPEGECYEDVSGIG